MDAGWKRYRILLANANGSATREWLGIARDEDAAIEAAEEKHAGFDVHTVGAE